MFKIMKMSKYNFITYDIEGNLIAYNFITGITSLTKVMKRDVCRFTQLFLTDTEISRTSCEEYAEAVRSMLQSGILVAGDADENVVCDSMHYNEVYDSKLSLTILPTGKCNFSCPYCYEAPKSFHREAMTIDNQNALLKFVQKNIPNHRALRVSWFGGEPLLEPEIIKYLSDKFIKICKARFLPYNAEMVTNGYYLDADMFDMLYKLKVYNYMITVDGLKEQHDKLRFTSNSMGSYDVIMKNLLMIRDSKQYKFANIIIRVNVSSGFLDMLDDFVSFISSSFSDDARFKIEFVPVSDLSSSKNSENNLSFDVNEMISHLHKNEVYMSKLYSDEFMTSQIATETKCTAALKNSYVITPDLSAYKCYVHFNNHDFNKVGHISLNGDFLLDDTLHKRWYLANKFIQKLPDSCKDCFYLPCCRQSNPGCPVRYYYSPSMESCTVKDEKSMEQLNETILYVAHKKNINTIEL